jgi:TolB protein
MRNRKVHFFVLLLFLLSSGCSNQTPQPEPVLSTPSAAAVISSPTPTGSMPTLPPSPTPLPLPGGTLLFDGKGKNGQEIFKLEVGSATPIQITNDGFTNTSPSGSPDGKWVLFDSYRDGQWDIYEVSSDGAVEINLTNSPTDEVEPAFSPDGKEIAYTCGLPQGDQPGNANICVMYADGSSPRQLTHTGTASSPTWAADGEAIYYTDWVGGVSRICKIRAQDEGITVWDSFSNSQYTPALAPDGGAIAVSSPLDSRFAEIYLVKGTNDLSRLTYADRDGSFGHLHPAWSPNGDWIAYSSSSSASKGHWTIHLIRADGSSDSSLTPPELDASNPAWFPAAHPGNALRFAGQSSNPRISADGRVVVFESTTGSLVAGGAVECSSSSGSHWCSQIYAYDRPARKLTLISRGADGHPGNGDSGGPILSADGHFLFFYTDATNIVPGLLLTINNVATDLQSGFSQPLPFDGALYGVSSDGRFLVYLKQPVSDPQVYVFDRLRQTSELISASPDGTPADGDIWSPSISGDGRWVAFWSWAGNLTADDEKTCPQKNQPDMSCGDVFLYDRLNQRMMRIPVGDGHGLGMGPYTTSLSDNGNFLAYNDILYDRLSGVFDLLCGTERCSGQLFGDGRWVGFSEGANVYIYDRTSGQKTLVSITNAGEPGDGVFMSGPKRGGEGTWTVRPAISISGDGRTIAFDSNASNLAPGDTTPCPDPFQPFQVSHCMNVFVHDRVTGQTDWISQAQASEAPRP